MKKHPQQLSFLDAIQDEVEQPIIQVPHQEKGNFPEDLITDFERFIDYCQQHKVALTKTNEYMTRKHLVALNDLSSVKAPLATVNSDQKSYPYIHFLYHLAISGRLMIIKRNDASAYLLGTDRIDQFKRLTRSGKYCALLEIFWVDTNWQTLTTATPEATHAYIFAALHRIGPGMPVSITPPKTPFGQEIKSSTWNWHYFLLYFEWFGLWQCEDDLEQIQQYFRKDAYFAKSITLTKLGTAIMPILIFERSLEQWNIAYRKQNHEPDWFPGTPTEDIIGFFLNDEDYDKLDDYLSVDQSDQPFHQPFIPHFPAGELTNTLPREQERYQEGTYTFKVLYESRVWRKLVFNGQSTMDDLHQLILQSYGFEDEHLYAFFMDGKKWSHNCIGSPNDEFEHTDASLIRIDTLGLQVGQRFLYVYDFGAEWTFIVEVEGIDRERTDSIKPFVLAEKGEGPEQYFDWDEDDDEDEEWE